MKKNIFLSLFATVAITVLFTACKKENDAPVPVEGELITTLKLTVSTTGFSKSFVYKVENGFGGSGGSIQIDTLALAPNTTYDVVTEVLNEKETPAENITEEVIEENVDHLFIYKSTPASGNGAITTSGGSKDNNGGAFNQTIKFTTGDAGNGSLAVYLMHLPTDKNGTDPASAGGATDVEAAFPVRVQ